MNGTENSTTQRPDDNGTGPGVPGSPFSDLSAYVAIPRLSGMALSPDGTRLVTAVATPAPDATRYVSALWEIDPEGQREPRRLTRSAAGEASAAFLPDGDLLFTSARQRPAAEPATNGSEHSNGKPEETGNDAERTALWLLPTAGEARLLADRPGGIEGIAVARRTGRLLLSAPVLPGASAAEDDSRRRAARKRAGVSAMLHERVPARYWDHDLGPAETRMLTAEQPTTRSGPAAGSPAGSSAGSSAEPVERLGEVTDLTTDVPGRVVGGAAVSDDGRRVAYTWWPDAVPTDLHQCITVVALSGAGEPVERQTVTADDAEFFDPVFTPDGRGLLCLREALATWTDSIDVTLWYVDLATGEGRDLTPEWDLWPTGIAVSPTGDAAFVTADEAGHCPIFRVALVDGEDGPAGTVTRLTGAGAYTDVVVSADGDTVFALGCAVDAPPAPVRLDARTADQKPTRLPAPGEVGALPGTLTEVTATAADGAALRSWLVLPDGACPESPAPLLLWVHGGPLSSWNAWHWRWNPWLLAAQGYAVLLPDPALSTGYGRAFVQRGWGDWSGAPYTDLMTLTDATVARDDVDAERTAAMGGSFGGYMVNWIAGSTDRFAAIITHASLWNLLNFAGTTDGPWYWQREFGDPLVETERYERMSPHRQAGNIRTPVLVIHGDKDYRVPVGEAFAMWYDLRRFEVPSKFLYFPDENHWILKPGNARIWYETVFAFLAEHVRGEEWKRPELL
jgi:dipeptidyl aminopeptidase/acylaminoacyl peptidase